MSGSHFEELLRHHPITTIPALRNIERFPPRVPQRDIVSQEILDLFPQLAGHCYTAEIRKETELKIGVVFSGGPAPGGNNILCGIFDALREIGRNVSLIGFLGGPAGLVHNQRRAILPEEIAKIRNMGGFDLLTSGRTKIENDDDMTCVIRSILENRLDGLVVIGGDDSNTNAAFIAERVLKEKIPCSIIGVPKTIDGDLRSENIPISFGFDTATKVYSNLIGNLAKDCLSTKKYFFFVRLMGRAASHITLECALQTQPNLAIISEEIAAKKKSLRDIIHDIVQLVVDRIRLGKPYGLLLIPEGLIESLRDVQSLIKELNILFGQGHPLQNDLAKCTIPQERLHSILDHLSEESRKTLAFFPPDIELQLLEERDPHGNVQVSKIETERLIVSLVHEQIKLNHREYLSQFSPQTTFYGYEGRSTHPTIFDATYCYNLGRLVAASILHSMHGVIASIGDLHTAPESWIPKLTRFIEMLNFEKRGGKRKAVIKKTRVHLDSDIFQVFLAKRTSWQLNDAYIFPPPIQYFGAYDIFFAPCLTVSFSQKGL